MSRSATTTILLAWSILLAAALLLTIPRTRFVASVTEMLPGGEREVEILRELADSEQGRQLIVRLYHKTEPLRGDARNAFLKSVQGHPAIEAVWPASEEAFAEPARVLFHHRYTLFMPRWLDRHFPAWRSGGEPAAEGMAAAVVDHLDAYLQSPDSFSLAETIPADPFLLMQLLGESSGLVPQAPAAQETYFWIQQAASPFASEGQQPVFAALHAAYSEAAKLQPELAMEFSGLARFADSSKSAIKGEIQRLNLICLLVVLAISIHSVRHAGSILRVASVVALSFLTAGASVVLLFPSVHILALVIGSILTGIAVDYGFHLILLERTGMPRRRVIRTVVAGSLSSAAGFITLLWAPFPFLNQVGAFVGTGLIGALFASLLLRPRSESSTPLRSWRPTPFILPKWIGGLLLIALLPGLWMWEWRDSIHDLEYPLPDLWEQAVRLRRQAGFSSQYTPFIVAGENLVAARARLAEIETAIAPAAAVHLGLWIPLYGDADAAQSLWASRPHFTAILAAELEARDYMSDAFHPFREAWKDYLSSPLMMEDYLSIVATVDKALPGPLGNLVHDKEGLAWFLMLAPPETTITGEPDVFTLDQASMLGRAFARYRESMLSQAGICLLVLAGGIVGFFGFRMGTLACLFPAGAILAAAGLAGYLGLHLGLFHVVGAFLAYCIGLDFALFAVEARRLRCRLPASIPISAMTTAAVFGVLATSLVPAIQALGLTVLVVLTLTVLFLLCGWPCLRAPRVHDLSRLPHGPEALLIDDIQSLEGNSIAVSLKPSGNPAVASETLLEALAQAAAVLVSRNPDTRAERCPGMLVAIRHCRIPAPTLRIGANCIAFVECLVPQQPVPEQPQLLLFRGKCASVDGRALIDATFSIYIP